MAKPKIQEKVHQKKNRLPGIRWVGNRRGEYPGSIASQLNIHTKLRKNSVLREFV